MARPADLASQILRLEQQLDSYQRLHAEEIAELRRALNECKRAIAALADERTDDHATDMAADDEP